MAQQDNLAPIYRYFTADLLTNQILAEIPFRGVNYERALRGAGTFQGSIAVVDDTKYLNLYNSTMPGNTALYVVRDGFCVWGGIIWARDYDIVQRNLNVSASEFTSYFYHRRIWKTWNHQFGATAIVTDDVADITLSLGSTTALVPGASVYLQFNNISFDRYNNYYQVGGTEQPTTSSFTIDSVTKEAEVAFLSREDGSVTLTMDAPHNFSLNDVIVVNLPDYPLLSGTRTISYVGGSEGEKLSFLVTGSDIDETPAVGSVTRTIPNGTYEGITVTVRADTYDYIRSLIDGVFTDFVGVDFPNTYIEPGIRYDLGITQRRLQGGVATLWTDSPHRLFPGQAVVVQNMDTVFDGEHRVLSIPQSNRFTFPLSGTLSLESVAPKIAQIQSIEAVAGDTTITTVAPHNFLSGQIVDIRTELGFDGLGRCLNDSYEITEIVSSTKFKYTKPSRIDVPKTTFTPATATLGPSTKNVIRAELKNNVATITTDSPHDFEVGDTLTIAGVTPVVEISQRALDAANGVATITTRLPHGFSTGDQVVISGLKDSSQLTLKTIANSTGGNKLVTFTTQLSHNFKNGDVVEISGLSDIHRLTNKALTSNVATMTTAENHNIPVSSSITIQNVYDEYLTSSALNSRFLQENVATLVLTSNHNIQVNEKVTVSGLTDVGQVISRELQNKIATLNLQTIHNFFVGDEIVVAGVGAPFDGTRKVTSVSGTFVSFEIATARPTDAVLPTRSGGTITSKNSVFNGEHVVTARTNTSISFRKEANPVSPRTAPNGKVRVLSSVFNGTHTVTGRTNNTFTFAKVANNSGSVAIPAPATQDIPPSTVSVESIHTGQRTVTAVTRNTFSFLQASITNNITNAPASGFATTNSVFNGTYSGVTVLSPTVFTYPKTGQRSNILEVTANSLAYARAPQIFNGSRTITAVDYDANTFSFARTHSDIAGAIYVGYGSAIVAPKVISSTFGPYPGNADIGLEFPTQGFSSYQVLPTVYRGFELENVGQVLDTYADNVNGFEYRIDCSYDETTQEFKKTFVFVPINFPDATDTGQYSSLIRLGAEKTIFEYPGSIRNITISESAENAATRFFVVGENDLGPDAGPPLSIASATDLLDGSSGRRWPLLDDSAEVDGIDDELILYAYARRYLSEANPPVAEINLEVNGSLPPKVGTYNPGDWCTVAVNDNFILSRLQTDLEPRDDVIVRKIESINVNVPDGATFPEVVQLTLIPEWEVDRRRSAR